MLAALKNRHLIWLAGLFIVGCTSLFKLTEGPSQQVRSRSPFEETSFLCTRSTQQSILGPQKNLNEDFSDFLKLSNSPQDFESKMILWALLNQNAHPFLAGPSSGVVIVLISGRDLQFLNFAPANNVKDYPYYKMMQFLRSRNPKGPSLKSLGSLLEKNYRGGIKVSPFFQESLQDEARLINASPELKKAFIRGDQVLSLNESISAFPFSAMVQHFESVMKVSKNLANIQPIPITFAHQEDMDNGTIKCNVEIPNYTQEKYHIKKAPIQNLFFGIKEGQTLALAITYFQSPLKTPYLDTPTLTGINQAEPPVFCVFESKNQASIVFSSHSRDPLQLLSQIITQVKINSHPQGVWEILDQAFYMYLDSPPRVIYSAKDALSKPPPLYAKLLEDYPSYYVEKLGELIGVQFDPDGSVFFLKRPSHFAQDCHN
ncbi:MAG: hypothetical protein A2X86_19845 [Bdellovibrionales bacterium GWA2_49_15]|nr:MAG: hypothetical protein A2X86_19845 [Bdellovibrionales bacterium GWA2_49_15]HAZ12514.1 hypothetical protein [Bdellovibrionales bacterium]